MAVVTLFSLDAQQAVADSLIALTGTASYNTSIKRTGTASIRCNPASGASGFLQTTISAFYHFGLYIAALPSVERRIFGAIAANTINVRMQSSGVLDVYVNTTLIGSSSALSTSTWYWVGIRTTSGTAVDFLQINGASSVTGTATASTAGTGVGAIGTEASAIDLYIDDVINDNAALLQPSKVALLLPTAQNSVTAATWQKPGGAVTAMNTSVDNIPPVGVAPSTSAAQAENQIRQAVSDATANVVFDMTTYTAAGIVAGDTVLATQAFAITSASTTAVTKTGSLETTNPTQAEVNFGAFGTGAASGTFPTGWQRRTHTINTAPAPTLGTAPTVEVGTRIANTTAGQVCFVGMHVAWTPNADAARVPYSTPYPQLLAH